MSAITLSTEENDLLDRCFQRDSAALATLSALPINSAVCEFLSESSMENISRSLAVLRNLPRDCAIRLAASRRRTDRLFALFEKPIRDAYRKTLARLPDEIEGGINQFWSKMATGGALHLNFDVSRGSKEESYIYGAACHHALRYFVQMLHHKEVALDAADEPTSIPVEPHTGNEEAWLVGDLRRLLISKELEAHHAIVFLLKALTNLGPSKLVASHLNSSFSTLLLQLQHSTEESGLSLAPLWQALRYQLELPADLPLGPLTVRELFEREGQNDAKDTIQRWLTEARRVCQRNYGEATINTAQTLSEIAAAKYRQRVSDRVGFLDRSARNNKTAPFDGLLWGWRHMFGVHATSISDYTCEQAAGHWSDRVRFVGCSRVPDELVKLLAGPIPLDTIGKRIASEHIDTARVIRNVEDRYRRAHAEGSKDE